MTEDRRIGSRVQKPTRVNVQLIGGALNLAKLAVNLDVVPVVSDLRSQTRALARLLFYDTLSAAWQLAVAGEVATLEQRADLMLASTHAVRTASQVADLIHRVAGTSGIYARSRLERHFRDAQTIRHHGFLSESRLETVGQVYLGVDPEFLFVAF
jgi:alkylation response protein AidB-like acyl-CoA dehydrogenase